MTTPLEDIIRQRIRNDGPMSVSEYMSLCLLHPAHGYYTNRQPFGASGDFITAPEVSQMFGELIGAWLAHAWDQAGRPSPFYLVEIGPGRGTLMKDLLRAASSQPAFFEGAQVRLIEASPALRETQKAALALSGKAVEWLDHIDQLANDAPLFLVTNELFDALPLRQFVKSGPQWRERVIALDDKGELGFSLGTSTLNSDDLPKDCAHQEDGTVFEYAPAREALCAQIARRLIEQGGVALHFDYGAMNSGYGDTLQAMRAHKYCSVFETPGQADLTSHVDFEALAKTASGTALPTITQAQFLLQCGLLERAGQLGAGKDEETQNTIRSAVERLAGAGKIGETAAGTPIEGMGDLFKVLCMAPPHLHAFLSPFSHGQTSPSP